LSNFDIHKDRPISASRLGELELGDINFRYDTILKVPSFVAHDTAKIAMARFRQDDVKYIPLVHATMWDGSEEDQVAYYGSGGGEHVLVEISYRYIDPHFFWFWLWLPDYKKEGSYFDNLFDEEIISEAVMPTKEKFGELLVAPCAVRIRTVKTDPQNFISALGLQEFENFAKESPWVKFWDAFKEKKYELAASYIREICELSEEKDTQSIFLGAVQALCYFLGKQNIQAANQFMQMGINFHKAHLDRYCDLCFFFAIEATKGFGDLNLSSVAMKRIAKEIPSLTPRLQKEISDILLSYVVSVYTGAGVLCRRTLELPLTQILTNTYKMSIDTLINKAIEAGVLKSNVRRGFFTILKVAEWKGVLTSSEFKVASKIKDFGDLIHAESGAEDAVETKYAIYACIHILRKLQSKLPCP
jgi:hypothetical protein